MDNTIPPPPANIPGLGFQYNYLDLRFHSYMYEYDDFNGGENHDLEFFHYILNEEEYAIEDFPEESIHDALQRQFELVVGNWGKRQEQAFKRIIDTN